MIGTAGGTTFLLQGLRGTIIKHLVFLRNFSEIWKRYGAGITMLVFIRSVWISGGGWWCLDTFLSVSLHRLSLFSHNFRFRGFIIFVVCWTTCLFIVRVIESLASSCRLSLLRSKSTSTNSMSSSSSSELESLLYLTTRVKRLLVGCMGSDMTKFEFVMPGRWWSLADCNDVVTGPRHASAPTAWTLLPRYYQQATYTYGLDSVTSVPLAGLDPFSQIYKERSSHSNALSGLRPRQVRQLSKTYKGRNSLPEV